METVVVFCLFVEPKHGYHATQEEIALGEREQGQQGTPAQQSEVGMIVHEVTAQRIHETIEGEGCQAFEGRVGVTFLTYSIYDVGSLAEVCHHTRNHFYVILQVCIYADDCFCAVGSSLHPCP